jgi:hypothetical protein
MSFCFTQLQQRPVLTSGGLLSHLGMSVAVITPLSLIYTTVSNDVHFVCNKVDTGSSTR